MFEEKDISFAIKNYNKVIYENNEFYIYNDNKKIELNKFYDTEFVLSLKFSYFLIKNLKIYDSKILNKILLPLNIIFITESYQVNYKKILNNNILPDCFAEKIYDIFFNNSQANKTLFNFIQFKKGTITYLMP